MSQISRRDFLNIIKKGLAATGVTALLAPFVAYFYPPTLEEQPSDPVRVGTIDDIPPGESVTVPFGRYPAIVIHTEAGLKAYSAVCTHFACIVKWDKDEKTIYCPCHEGYFEPLQGNVVSGPPPFPLEKLSISIENGDIYVGGDA
jgi:cytochrome b6-f complex iron-sulfur subunit